jgi:glycogen debranching enzyme
MATGDDHPALTNAAAERWMRRARQWLDGLETSAGLRASSAAGQFHAVFGRDTLWSLLLILEAARLRPMDEEFMRWAAALAARELRALAACQGTVDDPEIEEQPGKIIHEYWPEPPAHLIRIGWPLRGGRYYGSVDATYLFLMAVAAIWEQVPEGRALVASLWENVLAALQWALAADRTDGDGLVVVSPRQPRGAGLRNQVWKDSDDSLVAADGSFPEAPVAWVELSAYPVAAFRGVGAVAQERGADPALLGRIASHAARTAQSLSRFWLPEEGCPAMALTRAKAPIPLVASNIGHVLWCGALPEWQAQATADRLVRPDLLTAWGVRTLSASSYAFDPYSYHRGSVWPFDSAIAAAALWRLGRRDDARRIARNVLDAIERFDTPVELYCVLPRSWVRAPDIGGSELLADYRRASAVQAWSAAAVLLLAAQLLSAD